MSWRVTLRHKLSHDWKLFKIKAPTKNQAKKAVLKVWGKFYTVNTIDPL